MRVEIVRHCCIFSLTAALVVFSCLSFAQIKTKPGPPPGFEEAALAAKQTNLLDVVYNGQLTSQALAHFSSTEITFEHPDKVVASIPNLKDKSAVVKALSGSLATHEDHLCAYDSPRPFCTALNPQVAGVILDQRRYRVYLFINPHYVAATKQSEAQKAMLPTADHSIILQNSFVASGTKNDQAYALSNQSIWAYRNNRANVDISVQENNDINDNNGFSQMTIQRASLGRLEDGRLYEAGQLTTPGGSDFITQQYFLGAMVRNYNTGLPEGNRYGSPLTVYLTTPSTVRVYRRGILIATQQFNAGQHFIDTSNFPSGAYDVSIQITQNATSQVRTITRFYIKQTALPVKGKWHYSLAGGVLQRNVAYNENKFVNVPMYQSKSLVFLNTVKALYYNLGWQNTAVLNARNGYLSEHLNYYGTYVNISPGVMIGSPHLYGASMAANTHFNIFSLGANALKIWGRNKTNLVGFNANEVFSSKNQPLTYNDMRINLFASANVGKGDLYASATYTQSGRGKIDKEYSVSYTQNLYAGQFSNLNAGVTVTRSDNDTTYLASISYEFNNSAGYNASIRAGYSHNTNPADAAQHGDMLLDATVGKQSVWDYSHRLDASVSAHRSSSDRYVSAVMTYVNDWLRSNGSIQRSFANNDQSTSYSAEVDSNLVYAKGHVAFGYSQGYQSGVIIDVLSPEPATVKVMVDGAPVARVNANRPTSIYLEPYIPHDISIIPEGETLFDYNKSPKRVMLYRGNIQFLPWTLAKQYILFTKIVDKTGKPVKEALLKTKKGFNETDAHGYIQANVTTKMTRLSFEKLGGGECTAILPRKIHVKDNFAQLDKLVCA